jgi:hypothetical protein
VTQIRPHVIFSAHDHKSRHISADAETGRRILAEMLPPSAGPVWQYQLNDGLLHELMVPTCSYRMGVADMGFGAAVIGKCSSEVIYMHHLCLPGPNIVCKPYEHLCICL